jgi:hypothetical protein
MLGMGTEVFLIFAGLLLIFDLVLLSVLKSVKKGKANYWLIGSIFAFILVLVSCGRLLQVFISNEFSLVGVYYYSS